MHNSPPEHQLHTHTVSDGDRLSKTGGAPDAEISPRNGSDGWGSVGWLLLGVAAFSLLGIAFALWLRDVPAGRPDPRIWFNVFYVLFARHEPLGLGIVALFSVASALVLFRRHSYGHAAAETTLWSARWVLPLLAAAAFLISAVGVHLVCHNYALTADENLADFQAKIFLRGQVQAQVPEQWIAAVRHLKPTFVAYFPSTHSWNAQYLPVYAAMRAVFQSVGLQALLNPLLAAISVLALYGAARNIWPERKENAVIAAALLASSSQFLVMAMTSYAMPAHLALNTVWLWLYSRPEKRRFYLAPLLGVLAIGLHQPIVHALFVSPFLFRIVLQRRWRAASIFATIYLIGCIGWFLWTRSFQGQAPSGVGSMFKFLNFQMLFIQPMNLLLVVAWASLATPLLALLGYRRFFRLPPILQDCAISFLLTFSFYYFFYLDQAHGWGYRYVHGALACLVLIAVAGWNCLAERVGDARAKWFVAAGVAVSLLVQLPLRCFQAESFIRPYARTAAALNALPVDMIGLDPRSAWYSADLIRNDPFLTNRPLVVSLYGLTPEAVAVLEKAGTVEFIETETLAKFGMHTTPFTDYKHDPFQLGLGK